jgi:uncharacterized membrane protein
MLQEVLGNRISPSNNPKNYSTVKFVGTIGGILGGLFLMLTGVILSIVSYFDRASFHGLEVILIFAAFIFLAIGSHCLDLIESEKKASSIERCKRLSLRQQECLEQKSATVRFR